jgi:septal ring factor EnvC (AmiA/AmiB activator)
LASLSTYAGLIVATLGLAPLTLHAEPTTREDQLSGIEQLLRTSKSAQQDLAAAISARASEQEEISRKLVDISARIQSAEVSISESETAVKNLEAERAGILSELGEKQDILSDLLAGLQRLDRNPPPALVVEPGDVLAALRGAMLFGTIIPELRGQAESLAQDLDRLDRLEAGIKSRKKAIAEELAGLEQSRLELSSLIDNKNKLLASDKARLEGERRRASELAGRASSLKQLLASLAADEARAAEEEARKAAAAEKAKRLEEEARMKPRLAFAEAKGRLSYPVQGQILKNFGDPSLSGTLQGTAIAARAGAQVVSPADGRIEFAGPFRSYGQLLIIDAGSGYHLLLAGMERITANAGEFLRAGEPVGTMGNGPSSVTLLGDVMEDGRPVLYIEFRNSSAAIDSRPWWIGGVKQARG